MHNPTQYYFLGSCWSEFKQKFPTIYMFDWLIWPPSQGINFLYVPSKYRYIRTLSNTVGVIRNGILVFLNFSAQDASILKISVPIIKRRS